MYVCMYVLCILAASPCSNRLSHRLRLIFLMIFMLRRSSFLVPFRMSGSKWWRNIYLSAFNNVSGHAQGNYWFWFCFLFCFVCFLVCVLFIWKFFLLLLYTVGFYIWFKTLSSPFWSRHTKRNKNTLTSKHEDHKKKILLNIYIHIYIRSI